MPPLALSLASLLFISPGVPDSPDIRGPAGPLDFGVLLEGENRIQSFELRNHGDADLSISRVHPSCGCAIARILRGDTGEEIEIDKTRPIGQEPLVVLKPGEHIDVEVTYRSLGQPHRRITKYVDVFSDDPDQDRLRVPLTVEVRKAYTLEPKALQLGDVLQGAVARGTIHFTPEPGVGIRLTGMRPTPGLEVELRELTLDDGRTAWAVDVAFEAAAAPGSFSRTLGLLTNHSEFLAVKVPVFAEVLPVVELDTGNEFNSKLLDFGMLPPGERHTRSVQVTNHDPGVPFRITGVEIETSQGDPLVAKVEPLEDGVRYRIDVSTRPDFRGRFFKGKLIVNADHPEQKMSTIYLSGWFKSR